MRKSFFYSFCFIVLLTVLSACKDQEDIKVYRVSKEIAHPLPLTSSEHPSRTPGMELPGSSIPAEQAGPVITSTPPAEWESQPPTAMRLASFLVKGEQGTTADISLVMLGGPAGGGVENVNRWLSQLGQPAVDETKLSQIAKHVPSKLGDVLLVDLEGLPSGGDPAKDGRILGGIISGEGKTIFFKMRGNAALTEAQKENFIHWIATVRMEDPAPAKETTPSENSSMPDLTPMQSVPGVSAEELAKPEIKWVVPTSWKSVPATSMRYASFTITGSDGATGDLSVSVFPGEAGGDLKNVNRWREQIGLEPVTDLTPLVVLLPAKNAKFSTVDMTGSKGHLLVGWVLKNGNTWFFKLLAPDSVITREKEKFTQFLQSTEF